MELSNMNYRISFKIKIKFAPPKSYWNTFINTKFCLNYHFTLILINNLNVVNKDVWMNKLYLWLDARKITSYLIKIISVNNNALIKP
jgi:hypothetical protein